MSIPEGLKIKKASSEIFDYENPGQPKFEDPSSKDPATTSENINPNPHLAVKDEISVPNPTEIPPADKDSNTNEYEEYILDNFNYYSTLASGRKLPEGATVLYSGNFHHLELIGNILRIIFITEKAFPTKKQQSRVSRILRISPDKNKKKLKRHEKIRLALLLALIFIWSMSGSKNNLWPFVAIVVILFYSYLLWREIYRWSNTFVSICSEKTSSGAIKSYVLFEYPKSRLLNINRTHAPNKKIYINTNSNCEIVKIIEYIPWIWKSNSGTILGTTLSENDHELENLEHIKNPKAFKLAFDDAIHP